MTTVGNLNLKSSGWYKQATTPYWDGSSYNRARDNGTVVKAISVAVTGAGRIGFYVAYSELTGTGTHTFYVQRTHGTSGAVSIDYASAGDTHTTTSGTISWGDGEADIKSFTVAVPTKASNGDHRIYVTLSNPVGGAAVHTPSQKAYGIIDDSTVPADADAVFYDSAAGTGTGTAADPYGSIYTAIANVGSKKYICGKGTTTVGTTDNISFNGGGAVDCIFLPSGRVSEATRLTIKGWPGFTWTVTGGAGTTKAGFYSDGSGGTVGDSSFITFRDIDFSTFDTTGTSAAENGGINYFKTQCTDVTVEYCTFDNINGSSNSAGVNAYNLDGLKVWRSTVNNVQFNGVNTNQDAPAFMHYDGTNHVYERNTATNCGGFVFEKSTKTGTIQAKVSFNIVKTVVGYTQGAFATSTAEVNYSLIQGNLFKNNTLYYAVYYRGASAVGNDKQWIFSNVFDNCGAGTQGAIYSKDTYELQIFNNISYNSRMFLDIYEAVASQSDPTKTQVTYANYNHLYGSTLNDYRYFATYYATSAALNAVYSNLAGNDSSGDPLFTNTATDDYTLGGGSPCLTTGVGGTDKGIYLAGIEVIGA